MLNILGKRYYINVDEIIKICRADYGTEDFNENKKSAKGENGETLLELNVFKFEVFKACIERILYEDEEIDEKLGVFAAEDFTSVSFKIAFNTLLKYNILIEDYNE